MSDQGQLIPLIDGIEKNLGRKPKEASADAGYCSEANLADLASRGIGGYIGQIKQARGFRQFLLRSVEKVRAEWAMICTAHNLTKLAKAA